MKKMSLLFIIAGFLLSASANAKPNIIEFTQKAGENQIRKLLEPLIDKYCHDECRLMSVQVSVDLSTPDEVAPGFEEIDSGRANQYAPSSGRVKVLIDDKVGPISRNKLVELLQQFLDTLDFPVKIDTQVTHFPQPVGSLGRVGEIREKLTKQFRSTLDSLFQQFCPDQCLLADFSLSTEVVNSEEAQYGTSGEFVQDGDTALRIRDISGTILMDETLSPEERLNILEMARLRTNYLKNSNLAARSMRFPHPEGSARNGGTAGAGGSWINGKWVYGKGLSSSEKMTSNSESKFNSNLNNNSTNNTQDTNTRNDTNSSNNKSNSTNSSSDTSAKQEKFERFEKIERVENGDAVQAELQKFKVYGLIFACSVISLLLFIALATYKPKLNLLNAPHKWFGSQAHEAAQAGNPTRAAAEGESETPTTRGALISKRYEIERFIEELSTVYAQHPKVAKQVFSRVLTEEGVETTSQYIEIFGESIVIDMLRDPSLQTDINELTEYYAKNPVDLTDDEKLDLLRRLHNRTVAGKLVVLGNRSSNLFDFLSEMDGLQILELIRTENITVKSIVLTQTDPQKRSAIYAQLDEDTRMRILTELSRIDYLPRDYIFNVANALKRKRKDNPRLNTEALPGSEVLVSLLERTGKGLQRTVIKNLEVGNPDNARNVKSKLVSIETLRYLRDGQLLEVVLSLKHDELLQFLKGAPSEIRNAVFSRAPKELAIELDEELGQIGVISREVYQNLERKVLNRMKVMANEGLINLVETNERMFANGGEASGATQAPRSAEQAENTKTNKVVGW